jgi:hypothetical protein
MKAIYKFIHFEEIQEWNGAKAWACRNNKSKDLLGRIMYYPPWHQYVYAPNGSIALSFDCLGDIADFLKQIREGQ